MSRLEDMTRKIHSLVIFRNLLDDDVLQLLLAVLTPDGKSMVVRISDYCSFTARLFEESTSLTEYLWDRIASNENIYVKKAALNEGIDPILKQCLISELRQLEELSQLTGHELKQNITYDGYLPDWNNHPIDFVHEYQSIISRIDCLGYGIFYKYHVFNVADKKIIPVQYPDRISLSDLKQYESERNIIIENTKSLLSGKPAANTLLYGDAGTGKSSTVKAIVNEYANQGLRLIEIRKNQLAEIPAVLERLHLNPLKFILFIDDLSFAQSNEEIGVLKAILEGTVSAKAYNSVIYATSNRRHLINERFSDRGNDEIHANETIQEQASLSERFGLSVRFSKPDQAQFLRIVRELAVQYSVCDIQDLDKRAELYAMERGGRSPRIARHFVESIKRVEK